MGGGEEEEEAATSSRRRRRRRSEPPRSPPRRRRRPKAVAAAPAAEPARLPRRDGRASTPARGRPPPSRRTRPSSCSSSATAASTTRWSRAAVDRLGSMPRVSTFVVPAAQIARYASIAQGVDVDRVPALVVLRRSSSTTASPPAPSSYGFQSPESVVQAVVDAGYKGRTLAYHPLTMDAVEYPGATCSRFRTPAPRTAAGRSSRKQEHPGPDAAASRAVAPAASSPTSWSSSATSPTSAPARRSKRRATAGQPPEALLLEQGAITAEQLARAVAERYGLDHVDLSTYQVDMAAANLISVTTARRYRALPVGFVDRETLLVAMADPTNVLAVDDIQIATGARLPGRGRRRRGHRGADRPPQHASERRHRGDRRATSRRPRRSLAGVSDMQVSAEDAPVVKLVYSILGQAVGRGRLRRPLRARRGRDAGPLPDRRRAARGRARAEADDQRRRSRG